MFTVKVNDIDNDTIIKNVATVGDDKPEIEHKYIEPVIDVTKTVTKEDGNEIKDPNYVLEGQTIVYRITVTNTGSKETDAVVTDTIPEGLSIVPGSVIIASEETTYTSADLAAGITVNVPAKGKNEEGTEVAGQTIVEFKVTVDELAEGILTIETDKYIKPLEYNVEIINSINKLTTTIIGKAKLLEQEATTEISLTQPTLQISSSINNSNLSTVIENENIEMRVALQTNNNTNQLFKNPVIEIELPPYIQEIKFKKINVLYNTELQAKAGDVIINENGNKVIKYLKENKLNLMIYYQ